MAHSSALVLLLVAAFLPWIPTTSAFLVLVERTPSSSSRHRHDLNHYNQRRTSPILVATFLDSLPDLWSGMGNDANTNNKNVAAPKISQTLVEILLARRQRGISSGEMDETVIDATIQTLIQELADLQVTFDPEECLNGPLFVVLHQQGPKVPLWEKIGFLKKKQGDNPNIQGQQYSSISDMEGGGNEPVEADFKVRNYAEILGKSMSFVFETIFLPAFILLTFLTLTLFHANQKTYTFKSKALLAPRVVNKKSLCLPLLLLLVRHQKPSFPFH